MADDDLRNEPDDVDEDVRETERDEELSTRRSVKKAALAAYKDIQKGFEAQYERSNEQTDYWDCYNGKLGGKQFYTGNSKIFVPIIYDAINARKTRFTNQIFPVSGRNVEVTTEDGTYPYAIMSLAEHYIRKAQLRTKIMPALMKCGDIEGQYNIYVSWRKTKRLVTWRAKKPVMVEGFPTGDEVDDVQEEELVHGAPDVEVLSDSDILVLPATADSLMEAIENGGSVTILRRWSKAKIKQMVEDGEIVKNVADSLVAEMLTSQRGESMINRAKTMTDAAGIKGEGTGKFLLVYESWMKLKIDGEKRICRVFYGGEKQVLGVKRNPFWSDHIPLISAPVEKVHGSFKGRSKVAPVADLQYQANDAVNEAMDSAAYALMPIVLTDPARNPRIGSMILSMSAIWETDPNSTKFAQFPALWKDGMEIVAAAKSQIMQSLGVNPAMITQTPQKIGKRNQAEIAQEQQVELVTTADAVTVIEEAILTPLIARFIELDHQFRDEDMLVLQYGQMGIEAQMEKIPPIQFDRRYQFRWYGVESARNAQQIQQQIAGMNVLRGIPPEVLGGYKVNLSPIVVQLAENTFGPRLAPLVLEPPEKQLPVPVEQENMLLINGYEVPTHQMDDDQQHIQAHTGLMQAAMASENVQGGAVRKIQAHIFKHMQQMQAKQQAAMQQQQGPPGQPGTPGGAGPGVPGQPRIGAQPGQPRGGQGPPGMIHQDQMKDPSVMPRSM